MRTLLPLPLHGEAPDGAFVPPHHEVFSVGPFGTAALSRDIPA